MKILSLALVAALAAATASLPTTAEARQGDRWHNNDRHHHGWNHNRRHQVCSWTWRHHHRVRVCRWR